MGKAEIKTIRVPKWATFSLLLLVSAAMVGTIYALSGRAYVPQPRPAAEVIDLLREHSSERPAILATIAPYVVDILFFVPWGALAFLAVDRADGSRRRSYAITLLVGVAFALVLTAWQETLPTRVMGWVDAVWNVAGCLVGAIAGHARKQLHVRFE